MILLSSTAADSDFSLSISGLLTLLLVNIFSINLLALSRVLVSKFPSLAVSSIVWYCTSMPLQNFFNNWVSVKPWCGQSLWYPLNLFQELLNPSVGPWENVQILSLIASALLSSKNSIRNAVLTSHQVVRYLGGKCLSQVFAFPERECLNTLQMM